MKVMLGREGVGGRMIVVSWEAVEEGVEEGVEDGVAEDISRRTWLAGKERAGWGGRQSSTRAGKVREKRLLPLR